MTTATVLDHVVVTDSGVKYLLDRNPNFTSRGIVSPRAEWHQKSRDELMDAATPERIQDVLNNLIAEFPSALMSARDRAPAHRVARWLSVLYPDDLGLVSEGEIILAALLAGYQTATEGSGDLDRDTYLGIPREIVDRSQHLTMRRMPTKAIQRDRPTPPPPFPVLPPRTSVTDEELRAAIARVPDLTIRGIETAYEGRSERRHALRSVSAARITRIIKWLRNRYPIPSPDNAVSMPMISMAVKYGRGIQVGEVMLAAMLAGYTLTIDGIGHVHSVWVTVTPESREMDYPVVDEPDRERLNSDD